MKERERLMEAPGLCCLLGDILLEEDLGGAIGGSSGEELEETVSLEGLMESRVILLRVDFSMEAVPEALAAMEASLETSLGGDLDLVGDRRLCDM